LAAGFVGWVVSLNLEGDFKRKRLSKFLVQEMLYEFVTHQLDSAREKEITDYLETCRDSQRELENLSKGLRYTQVAGQLKISMSLQEALENFEPQWKKQLRAWTLWSSQRGWKVLPYVFVVAVIGLGLFITKPWQVKPNESVLLAEQIRKEPDMEPKAKAPPTPAAPSVPVAAIGPSPTVTPEPSVIPEPSPMPSTLQAIAQKLPVIKGLAPAPAPPVAEEKPSDGAVAQDSEEQMGRGFLFRSEITVNDFMNSWPAIRDKIVAMGGKVAGNVELGWLRRPTEAYFHFSLPESNLNELEIFLGTFGPVRFSKDRHPRVMPQGQIRIIMTVKDGMTQHETPPASP
jgi:hypothetical protein